MHDFYDWIKIVHILAVISWMAGLFYLPRLFVYHSEKSELTDISSVFGVMERRLLKAIMRPAGVVTLLSGVILVHLGGWNQALTGWLGWKLILVAGLVVFHGVLEMHAKRFREGRESQAGRYFRILNEIPTVLLIGIVSLVVLKPD